MPPFHTYEESEVGEGMCYTLLEAFLSFGCIRPRNLLLYLKWIIAKFCSKPRVSSSFYIMGNFFSSTVQGDSTSSVIITSNISGILSAVVATPAFSSLLVDYPAQTREGHSPATLEISKSLPSNPSPTIEPSKCTADCNAIYTVGNLRRQNDRAKEVSEQWIQLGRVVNSKQSDPDSTEAARARGTKTDSDALLVHQHIRTQPIEQAATIPASSKSPGGEVYEVIPQHTAVQVSIHAESVASTGTTTEVDDNQSTLLTPGPDSWSQSILHSANDMHGGEIKHQTPTTERITFKQQDNPSQVKEADRIQTITAQLPPAQAKSPLSPPPFRPPMVYFIPHVPIQLFGRPHGHHAHELMQ